MNASPLLIKIAKTLHMVCLETVMVGNAAAALHGAPVTTLDIDFIFRKTPTNMRKLKFFAEGYELKVASLEKIIRSKKTLGRPRDLAVIEILERTLDEKKKKR